jgi:uncharacterized protein YbjT (DUF2867 family)
MMLEVCVVGATGATGKDLVQLLLERPEIGVVRIFVRKNPGIQHQKLTVHLIDFNNPESWRHWVTGDIAFSCMGTTLKDAGSKDAQWMIDYDYQFLFAQICKNQGISKFVLLSAKGAHAKSKIFYSKMKGQLNDAVKALQFPSLIVFKPGVLERKDSDRSGERMAVQVLKAFNVIGMFKKYRPLPTEELALAMINQSLKDETGYLEVILP